MKALISTDLEGMPFIVVPGHLNLKGTLYKEARKIATEVTLTVADELHKNGFNEIVIADSHGPMVNLLVEDLPEYVEIVRGYPRPVCMISGIEGCDIACFLGYHAKSGTPKSSFDHTYSGANVQRVYVNGVEASEFLLNTYAAGDLNVPVILVAGEAKLLEDDVKKHTPWIETAVLKRSLGRSAARSPSLQKIKAELREITKKAVNNFKQKKTATLKAKRPVKIDLAFKGSHLADTAELLPTVKRLDGMNVEYMAETMLEAYRIFELLILAATGTSSIIQNLS